MWNLRVVENWLFVKTNLKKFIVWLTLDWYRVENDFAQYFNIYMKRTFDDWVMV